MPAGTINGIAYEIDVQDYEADFSLFEGQSRTVVFQVQWSLAEQFIAALLGVPSVAGGPGQNFLRASPAQWPGGPQRLVCTRARLIGVGTPRPGTHLIGFDGAGPGTGIARIWATFEVPKVDISGTDANNSYNPQPWSSMHVEGRTRTVTYNKQGLVLPNGDNPPKDVRYRMLQERIVVTFEAVPWIYTNLYRLLCKNVNSFPMFNGWGAGQVLFDEYDFQLEIATDASYSQKVTLTFLCQPQPWNKVPADDDLAWVTVTGARTGGVMYPSSDLTPLLSFSS
jgi:hypothetical protein